MIKHFLYYILMAGVVVDGNPQGALRAIKDTEQAKLIIEIKNKKQTEKT